KAIDVMDEAGARARINSMTRPPDVKEIEKNIETIRAEKEAAIKAQDYEKAAALRDSEQHTKDELERILNGWREQRDEREVIVTGDDIMHIVSKWTGVPLNRMEQKEAQKLLKMEEELKQQVIGQDEAVIAISKALKRSRADLKDPRRPIGSFIFMGPTGVGKTFLARSLAEFMFGDADALFGLEIADLQGAIDLGVKAGTTTDKGQFSFAQRQIFRSLSIVEVGQALLLGVRQNAQELVLAGHCCAVPPASASAQPIRTSVSISVVRLTPKLRQTAAFDMPPFSAAMTVTNASAEIRPRRSSLAPGA